MVVVVVIGRPFYFMNVLETTLCRFLLLPTSRRGPSHAFLLLLLLFYTIILLSAAAATAYSIVVVVHDEKVRRSFSCSNKTKKYDRDFCVCRCVVSRARSHKLMLMAAVITKIINNIIVSSSLSQSTRRGRKRLSNCITTFVYSL